MHAEGHDESGVDGLEGAEQSLDENGEPMNEEGAVDAMMGESDGEVDEV